MKIRQLAGILALVSVLSIGAFGQTVIGRLPGLEVEPARPRMSEITYIVSTLTWVFWTSSTVA